MGCGVGLREEEGCLLVSGRDRGRVLSRSHMSGTMTIAAILPGLGEEQQEKGGREMARILLKPLSPKVSAWAREVVVVVRTRGPGRFIQSSVILPPPLGGCLAPLQWGGLGWNIPSLLFTTFLCGPLKM